MKTESSFFRLSEPYEEIDSNELYKRLASSKKISDVLYRPDSFEGKENQTTRITGTTFKNVSFSKTTLKQLIFRDCIFEKCLFIGAEIRDCEFHACVFQSTNFHKIIIEGTYIDPRSFSESLDPKKHQNIGVHLYQSLMHNLSDMQQPELEAHARFLFIRWKRFQEWHEVGNELQQNGKICVGKRTRIFCRWVWERLFGSGIRVRHYVVTVFSCVALITMVNFYFREPFGLCRKDGGIETIVDSFYFSTIALSTVGFGDITPLTQVGRAVVAGQGVLGFFLFATLASMLFRKIAPL